MTWQEKIKAAHLSVTNAVSHYRRLSSDRYFVWQEEQALDLCAGNVHRERAMAGTTDLFTKTEYDPWIAQLQAAFDAYGIAWNLESVQYEQDTGFIHYEWYWEVTDG